MNETLENHDTNVSPGPVRHEHRSNRLNRALAWVGIAAGSLFIVATVFFSGFILGHHGGGSHHGPDRMHMKLIPGPGGPRGPGGPMGPDGPLGPEGPDGPGRPGGPDEGADRVIPSSPQTSALPRP